MNMISKESFGDIFWILDLFGTTLFPRSIALFTFKKGNDKNQGVFVDFCVD